MHAFIFCDLVVDGSKYVGHRVGKFTRKSLARQRSDVVGVVLESKESIITAVCAQVVRRTIGQQLLVPWIRLLSKSKNFIPAHTRPTTYAPFLALSGIFAVFFSNRVYWVQRNEASSFVSEEEWASRRWIEPVKLDGAKGTTYGELNHNQEQRKAAAVWCGLLNLSLSSPPHANCPAFSRMLHWPHNTTTSRPKNNCGWTYNVFAEQALLVIWTESRNVVSKSEKIRQKQWCQPNIRTL